VQEVCQEFPDTLEQLVLPDSQVHKVRLEAPASLAVQETPDSPDHPDRRVIVEYPAGRETPVTVDLKDRPDLRDSVDRWVLRV